jgi:hypothetical protein
MSVHAEALMLHSERYGGEGASEQLKICAAPSHPLHNVAARLPAAALLSQASLPSRSTNDKNRRSPAHPYSAPAPVFLSCLTS